MDIPDIDYNNPQEICDFLTSDACMRGIVDDAYKYISGELVKAPFGCCKEPHYPFRAFKVPPKPPSGMVADVLYETPSVPICSLFTESESELRDCLEEMWVAHIITCIEMSEFKAKELGSPIYQDVVVMAWNEYDPRTNPEKLRPSIRAIVRNYY